MTPGVAEVDAAACIKVLDKVDMIEPDDETSV